MSEEPEYTRLFQNKGDAIKGDRIFARCQKIGKWIECRKSEQHRGQKTILRKDAFAVIEASYTNIKN